MFLTSIRELDISITIYIYSNKTIIDIMRTMLFMMVNINTAFCRIALFVFKIVSEVHRMATLVLQVKPCSCKLSVRVCNRTLM